MTRKSKRAAAREQRAPDELLLDLRFVLLPGCPPQEIATLREATEFDAEVTTRLLNVWQGCQAPTLPQGTPPAGVLTVNIRFGKRPERWTPEEGKQFLNALAASWKSFFLGSLYDLRPIDLPLAQGELTFQPFSLFRELLESVSGKAFVAEALKKIYNRIGKEDEIPSEENLLQPPPPQRQDIPQPEPPVHRQEEVARSRVAIEQLQAELANRLKGLIPILPAAAEGKAQAVLDLNRSVNQTFWGELRDEVIRLLPSLLQDIPSDYAGKRARALLVNGLLSALNLGILIRDDHGRMHVCSMQPVRGRESDERGYLRLQEKTISGSSRKSYPIPSPDEIQIIETPQSEPAPSPQPKRSGRGG